MLPLWPLTSCHFRCYKRQTSKNNLNFSRFLLSALWKNRWEIQADYAIQYDHSSTNPNASFMFQWLWYLCCRARPQGLPPLGVSCFLQHWWRWWNFCFLTGQWCLGAKLWQLYIPLFQCSFSFRDMSRHISCDLLCYQQGFPEVKKKNLHPLLKEPLLI